MYRELLLGCGHARDKRIATPGHPEWENLTTLDGNPECKPDVVWSLAAYPIPFEDNTFDEIAAYEVLEHVSVPDEYAFFREFHEYWRILKPNGLLCATVPHWTSIWAWGDPGHRRVINEGTLVFLSHAQYEKQLGRGPMSDYRSLLGETNFEMVFQRVEQDPNERDARTYAFVLRAIKP